MSSSINSSSEPLPANAEFPGAWEFLTVDKHGVQVVCSTDSPGNLVIEFSQNKIDINYTHTFTIEADVSFSRAVSKKGNYYKVRLVNGPSAQTTLQLVSIIQTTYQPDTLDVELDSATSSITIFGQDSDGTKRVVKTTTDGSLVISGGGGGGGDATASNQTTQITVATNSNLAVCSRLDTIDVSANNMEVQLDKLQFTSGNLHVLDTACLEQQQVSNQVLSDMLLSVDGINLKLNSLQTQQATYTIEAATTMAQATPAFTSPPSGIPKDEGWYFKNTSANQPSQVYYYSYLNPALQVPARQFAYTLGEITNSYAVVRILSVNAAEGLPTLGIYTRPTGSGDYSPGFYKSRRVYNLPSTAKLSQGMKILIWYGTIAPPLKIHPDLDRIQLQLALSNGPLNNTEQLAFLSINTDSAALAGNSEYILGAAGFQYGASFCVDTVFTGESSTTTAGDATAANQVSSNLAICSRLDTSNTTLGLINTNLDQLTYTGSNLLVYDAASNTNLGLVKDELITLNGVYTDLLSGTAQLSVALDPANDGVSLYAYNTSSMMPEALTLSTDSGMKALDVHVINQPTGYASESTLADISELVSGQSQYNRFQCEIPLSDTKLDTIITNMSLTNFNVTNLSKCDTDNVAIPGGVDINNLPTIQQVSLAGETLSVSVSGTVPISSGSALDVNCYGSSDGVQFHHLKTNTQGVLKTNAIMETDANGALTSELKMGTGAYNAIHCWVKNKIELDTNSTVYIQNLPATPIEISGKLQNQDSQNSVLAVDETVSGPVVIGGAGDTQGYLWISISIQFSEVLSGGSLYLEYSGDGAIWFRGNTSSEQTYIMPSASQVRVLLRPSTPCTFRYVRVYADTVGFSANNAYAWVSMK